MILFIYLELSHLKPEELHNFSQSLFAFLHFKFLERNKDPWPASVILIGLYWIGLDFIFSSSYSEFGFN